MINNKTHMIRAKRVKYNIQSKSSLPILQVTKTNQHIYASIFVEDKEFSYSTKVKNFKEDNKITSINLRNKACATIVGTYIGQLAKKNNIDAVVFFRGKHRYHGIIEEVANAARKYITF